jgi:DNA-binding transcriptional LysR family regulator
MNEIQLHRLDLNLLVVFEALMDEGSVVRAAEKLGKTPSAVSHALGRLREQLGDPLMVKVGGKMRPSPFAEALIGEVRPILATIARVVQPPQPFDPPTSHRVFRVAAPPITPLIAEVAARINAVAPNVGVEWVSPTPQSYLKVADGQVDLALGAIETIPEGAVARVLPPLKRYTFARDGHPALEDWGREAWIFWPHIVVGMAEAARQTVEERVAQLGVERRVGARIPEFSGVGPLLHAGEPDRAHGARRHRAVRAARPRASGRPAGSDHALRVERAAG